LLEGVKVETSPLRLVIMIGAFWNIKGLNKPGRSKCLCEFIIDNKLDFVGILESEKEKISDAFVDSICKDMI
jgi:hypothetical protein